MSIIDNPAERIELFCNTVDAIQRLSDKQKAALKAIAENEGSPFISTKIRALHTTDDSLPRLQKGIKQFRSLFRDCIQNAGTGDIPAISPHQTVGKNFNPAQEICDRIDIAIWQDEAVQSLLRGRWKDEAQSTGAVLNLDMETCLRRMGTFVPR